jgi:hypothetical protein
VTDTLSFTWHEHASQPIPIVINVTDVHVRLFVLRAWHVLVNESLQRTHWFHNPVRSQPREPRHLIHRIILHECSGDGICLSTKGGVRLGWQTAHRTPYLQNYRQIHAEEQHEYNHFNDKFITFDLVQLLQAFSQRETLHHPKRCLQN